MEINTNIPARPSVARVVFICSSPRSGSTILGESLGATGEFLHVGELSDFWARHLPEPRRVCTCLLPAEDCPFWNAVVEEAFPHRQRPRVSSDASIADRFGIPEADAMAAIQAKLFRNPFPFARRHAITGRYAIYRTGMDRLYEGIHAVSGESFIVDSSKWVREAQLACWDGAMIDVVDLRRDGRGVVLSRVRRSMSPDGGPLTVPILLTLLEGLRWSATVTSASWALRRCSTPITVRYDQFTSDPNAVMTSVLRHIGTSQTPGVDTHGHVAPSTSHSISGNRNRWQYGPRRIAHDDSFAGLSASDRALLSMSTSVGRLSVALIERLKR